MSSVMATQSNRYLATKRIVIQITCVTEILLWLMTTTTVCGGFDLLIIFMNQIITFPISVNQMIFIICFGTYLKRQMVNINSKRVKIFPN